jgi:predicted ATPase
MTERSPGGRRNQAGITQITVAGYKSIRAEQSIDIAPLTILAGANSSGKSSIMQPLLLLKQTLEAAYDPGPLLLDGANVRFTEAKQLFYRRRGKSFQIALRTTNDYALKLYFVRNQKSGLRLTQMDYARRHIRFFLMPNMTPEETKVVVDLLSEDDRRHPLPTGFNSREYRVTRNRFFLEIRPLFIFYSLRTTFAELIQSIIHLPGLRGNPERNYPVSAVGDTFPGTFEKYTASIIAKWQEEKSSEIIKLGEYLLQLGLSWKVEAKRVDDTKVELLVGRIRTSQHEDAKDLVSVADVGFGVSQTLPVLVALLVAKPGQLVYLEQPEIHLHPRAQVAMAAVLADAVKRRIRIVVETHSSLLLLAIQTLIAEGSLSSKAVKLYWFRRSDSGETTITPGELDEAGAFGDWPEDFGEVSLEAERRYLDAAEAKLMGQPNGAHEEE